LEFEIMRNQWTGAVLAIAFSIGLMGCSAAAAKAPDLSGIWRLDPASSTAPSLRGRGREGRPEGNGERRRWEGADRNPAASGRRAERMRGGSRLRLPDVVRIEQDADRVELLDSLGASIGEIVTGKASQPSGDFRRLQGKWQGDRLEVVQTNPRGGQMTQTYHLADDGRTLEVRMRMVRGDLPAREFVRVYRREGV